MDGRSLPTMRAGLGVGGASPGRPDTNFIMTSMGLLRVWTASKETLDTEVTIKEFCDRYEWISTLYDDDKDFDAMMRAAWRLK